MKWSRDNRGITATGALLLTYALPLKRLYITGKSANHRLRLSMKEVAEAIEAGHFELAGKSTQELLGALAPEIIASIKDMAPCNTMFSKGVMLAGIQVLARYHVAEGVPLAMQMYKWEYYGRGYVIQVAGEVIKQYGGAAASLLPELKKMQQETPDRYPNIGEIIEAVETDQNPPRLISLGI